MRLKRGVKALSITAGIIFLVLAALQAGVNSRPARHLLDGWLAEHVDARVTYGRLHLSLFSAFPDIRLNLEDLAVTYPHGRFAAREQAFAALPAAGAGRGAEEDTLLRLRAAHVELNVLALAKGDIRLRHVRLRQPAIYARAYDDSTANWQIFSTSPKDTTDNGSSLPRIGVRTFRLEDAHICYGNLADSLAAALSLQALTLGGRWKAEEPPLGLRRARLHLDSLQLHAWQGQDSLACTLDRLSVRQNGPEDFRASLRACCRQTSLLPGKYDIPIQLQGEGAFRQNPAERVVRIHRLAGSLAFIPIRLQGSYRMREGAVPQVQVQADIENCELEKVLRGFADALVPTLRDIHSDGFLTLHAQAEGPLGAGRLPGMEAEISLPESHIHYVPYKLRTRTAFQAKASVDTSRYARVEINALQADTDGLHLRLSGRSDDLFGERFSIRGRVNGHARLDSLSRIFGPRYGFWMDGDIDWALQADADAQELKSLRFRNGSFSGAIDSPRIRFRQPKDTMFLRAYNPHITLGSSAEGLKAGILVDSMEFRSGTTMLARVRDMHTVARMYPEKYRGTETPKIAIRSDNNRIFFKSGASRFGLASVSVTAAARKRVIDSLRMRQIRDSLRARMAGRERPDFLSEKDFAARDVHISLGDRINGYLREWAPSGSIRFGRGFMASPSLPLRTRLGALQANFNDNTLVIDTMHLRSGSSDLILKGTASGLRRFLRGRGLLRVGLQAKSNRLNINEIVAAMDLGKTIRDTSYVNEEDERFVTDSLVDAQIEMQGMRLFVVPANIIARVGLDIRELNYIGVNGHPLRLDFTMQERTMQIRNGHLESNVGDIDMNAYYATRTKKDICAGADIRVRNVSAHELIRLFPAFDSMMPALKSFQGQLECDISATTQIDTNMNVVPPSLAGVIHISGQELEIEDAGDLRKLTQKLLFKNKNIGHINNLSVDAMIGGNRLEVFPFILDVDRYTVAMQGIQGFDKSMNYHFSFLKSPFLFPFGIQIYGQTDNWKYRLTRARYRDGASIPVFTQEIDAAKMNIVESIQHIYSRGVDNIRKYNEETRSKVEASHQRLHVAAGEEAEDLGFSEMCQFEALQCQQEIEEQNSLLDREINEAVSQELNRQAQEAAAQERKAGRKRQKR
ncbi:MAG: hypothetical protein J5871_07040 [Bacteroidales bacterium]|nr:hypothetical protein [Bacteroidales bacterium]